MAARDLFGRFGGNAVRGKMSRPLLSSALGDDGEDGSDDPLAEAPLGGTRAEALQRLQVGLSGIFAMVLLVGLASAIGTQAERAEEAAVPDAAPTTEPTAAPPQRDPLADAGVVPDIPVEPAVPPPAPKSELGEGVKPILGPGRVPDTPPTEPQADR
ncbi:MAG: hypothetical protein WBA51_18925 [Erythrobacter sp.]